METGQAAGLPSFFKIFTKKLTSGTKEKGKLYKIRTRKKALDFHNYYLYNQNGYIYCLIFLHDKKICGQQVNEYPDIVPLNKEIQNMKL